MPADRQLHAAASAQAPSTQPSAALTGGAMVLAQEHAATGCILPAATSLIAALSVTALSTTVSRQLLAVAHSEHTHKHPVCSTPEPWGAHALLVTSR